MEVGVKESCKRNWRGGYGLVMWENGRRKICKESRCPESGGEMEARKIEIAMGDCSKRGLERVGEEWENYR